MGWLAINEYHEGSLVEMFFETMPTKVSSGRFREHKFHASGRYYGDHGKVLPNGTIKRLVGKEMNYADLPIQVPYSYERISIDLVFWRLLGSTNNCV